MVFISDVWQKDVGDTSRRTDVKQRCGRKKLLRRGLQVSGLSCEGNEQATSKTCALAFVWGRGMLGRDFGASLQF